MSGAVPVLALALFAQSPDEPPARHDRLRHVVGGTMSGPLELEVGLDDGSFTLSEPVNAASKDVRITRGRLDEPTTQRLRSLAAEAMRDGFVAARCRAKDYLSRIPTDALRDLTVRLDGRVNSSPNDADCWSGAAQALASAAVSAAHGR